MALTRCPDCGREVSTAAAACPGCGRPIADSFWDALCVGWKILCSAGAVASVGAAFLGWCDVAQRALGPQAQTVFGDAGTGWSCLIYGVCGYLIFVAIK